MRKSILSALLFLSTTGFGASDFQFWSAGFFEVPVARDWLLFAELQNRLYRDFTTERTLLARAAVGYRINDTHSVWMGYGWTPLFSPRFLDEHRLWQQTLTRYTWDEWSLSFRFRLEQRWLDGGGTAWRWREQLRASLKLSPEWSAVVWDEFFFNFNTTPAVPFKGFAQNRLFLGARWALSQNWAVEPGYMNVIQRNAGAVENDMYHVPTIYFYYRAEWTEPELPTPK